MLVFQHRSYTLSCLGQMSIPTELYFVSCNFIGPLIIFVTWHKGKKHTAVLGRDSAEHLHQSKTTGMWHSAFLILSHTGSDNDLSARGHNIIVNNNNNLTTAPYSKNLDIYSMTLETATRVLYP